MLPPRFFRFASKVRSITSPALPSHSKPGRLRAVAIVGFVLLWAPVLNAFVVLGFLMLGIAALALCLGDTWADWRGRARSTPL